MAARRRRGPTTSRPTKQHQDEASLPEPPRSCSTRRGRVVAYLQRGAWLSDRLQGLLGPVGQYHRARKRGASQRWRLGTAGLPLEHLRAGPRYYEQRCGTREANGGCLTSLYPHQGAGARASGTKEERSMRLGKQAWARRGVHAHSRTLEGKQRLSSYCGSDQHLRRGDDGRVCVPHRSETTERGTCQARRRRRTV